MTNANRILVDIGEATEMTGLSRSTIYRRLADGTLPAKKLGSRTLIEEQALKDWVAKAPAWKPANS